MSKDRRIDFEPHLSRLKDMDDYEVSDRDPDVRGWKVYSAEGIKFGKVEELIVDPDEMKVRYLDIEVDEGVEGVTEERHMLIPIGVASIDEKDDKVFIRTVQTVSLLKSPPYKGGIITRDYENELKQSYFEDKETKEDEEFYNSEYFNEDNFYRARRSPGTGSSIRLSPATAIIGEKVSSGKGDYLGKIEDVVVDTNLGKIAYAVISSGKGVLGIADKYFAVPWEILKTDIASENFYLSVSEEKLKSAPEFKKDDFHKIIDADYINKLYNYYGVNPY